MIQKSVYETLNESNAKAITKLKNASDFRQQMQKVLKRFQSDCESYSNQRLIQEDPMISNQEEVEQVWGDLDNIRKIQADELNAKQQENTILFSKLQDLKNTSVQANQHRGRLEYENLLKKQINDYKLKLSE